MYRHNISLKRIIRSNVIWLPIVLAYDILWFILLLMVNSVCLLIPSIP